METCRKISNCQKCQIIPDIIFLLFYSMLSSFAHTDPFVYLPSLWREVKSHNTQLNVSLLNTFPTYLPAVNKAINNNPYVI